MRCAWHEQVQLQQSMFKEYQRRETQRKVTREERTARADSHMAQPSRPSTHHSVCCLRLTPTG